MMIRKKICAVLLAGTLLVAGCLDDGPVPQDRETRNQDEAASLYSPPFLVIDRDRDGPDLIPLESSLAYFDVDGDGVKEHMGWIFSNDKFLLAFSLEDRVSSYDERTRKKNYTTHGLKKLEEYDINKDYEYNVLDAKVIKGGYTIFPIQLGYVNNFDGNGNINTGRPLTDFCKFKAIKLPEYKEEKIVLGHKILSEGTLVCEEGSYPLIEVRFRYEKSGDKHEHE